nr:MAG TPA: hypothetical protein [Caudoviricetes sp.]
MASGIYDNQWWNNRDLSKWDPNIGEPGSYQPKYGWDTDKYFPLGEAIPQVVGFDRFYPYASVSALVSALGETAIAKWGNNSDNCFPIVTSGGKNEYGTCPGGTNDVVFFVLPDDVANNNFGLYIKYSKTYAGKNAYAYKGGSKLEAVWTGTNTVIAKVGNMPVNGTYQQTLYRPTSYEGWFFEVGGIAWDDYYDYPVQRGEPSANSATSPWHGSSRTTLNGKYIAQVQIVLGKDESFSKAAPFGYALAHILPIYGFKPDYDFPDTVMGPTDNASMELTIKGRSGDAENFGGLTVKIGQYYSNSVEKVNIGTTHNLVLPYGEQFIDATAQFTKQTGNKIQVDILNTDTMAPYKLDDMCYVWIPRVSSEQTYKKCIFYHPSVTSSTGDIVIRNYSDFPGLGYIDKEINFATYNPYFSSGGHTTKQFSVSFDIDDVTFSADPNSRPIVTGIKVGKVDFRNHHHEMMLCGDKKDMYRVEVEGTAPYGGGMCNIYMGGVRVGTTTLPGVLTLPGFAVVPFSEGVNGDISAQGYDMKGFLSTGQLAATAIYLVDSINETINTEKPTAGVTYQKPYLYKYPGVEINNIWRSNSSGQEDLENGTYAYIQGTYYGFTKGGCQLNIKLIDASKTLLNQNTSDASGSFSGTYGTYDVDHNHAFSVIITDVFGGTISKTRNIYSAECFMDFRAGGRALGIGMAALGDNRVDIKWPIYAHAGIISSSTDTILSAQEISYLESADSITLKEKLDQMDAVDTQLTSNMSTLQSYVNTNVGADFTHIGSAACNDLILISLGANTDQKLAIATIKDREITRPTSASSNVYRQTLVAPWDSKGYKTVTPIYAECHLSAFTNGYQGVAANDFELDGQTAYGTYARASIGYTGGQYYVGYENDWPRKNNTGSATTCYLSGMMMAIIQPK